MATSTASSAPELPSSLVAAARLTAESGERLEAGWIVMAGGATAAEALRPGINVRNTVEGLGSVAFNVTA